MIRMCSLRGSSIVFQSSAIFKIVMLKIWRVVRRELHSSRLKNTILFSFQTSRTWDIFWTDDPDFLESLSSQGCSDQTDERFPKKTISFFSSRFTKTFQKIAFKNIDNFFHSKISKNALKNGRYYRSLDLDKSFFELKKVLLIQK